MDNRILPTNENFNKYYTPAKYTREEIIKLVEEEDVEFIRLQFTDIFGTMKNIAITASQLKKALDNRYMFDGSTIDDFVRIEESDMYLCPDLNTFVIFPWRPQQGKVARFICNINDLNGNSFHGDSRNILIRELKKAKQMGYDFMVGPECEFFLFDTDENGNPTTTTHEKGGYFDIGPTDSGENVRRDMVLTLEDMGYTIEQSYHEMAAGQHEIDFKYGNALSIADDLMTFKIAVKTIAKRHGYHASFMPKPKHGAHGSGMHMNFSLFKDGINIFSDENDNLGLSKEAYYFIGGLIKHIKAITAITNPIVNSYKRLVWGYEAPISITWSLTNKTALMKIPSERGKHTRIELQSPDASCNPYLAFAVCLAAGLDGINNKIEPPKHIEKNLFEMRPSEMINEGIDLLPDNLYEALKDFMNDIFIQNVLGEHITQKFYRAKKEEWRNYCSHVSNWELEQYLYTL